MRPSLLYHLFFACVTLLMASQASAVTPSFRGLGDLAGGSFSSCPQAISFDGQVVVGYSSSSVGTEAFLWQNGVMTALGSLSDGTPQSMAYDVTNTPTGPVVVGIANLPYPQPWGTSAGSGGEADEETFENRAFLWKDGVMTGLGGSTSMAYGVSEDGQTVIGKAGTSFTAVRWDDGVMTDLGYPSGEWREVQPCGISADGAVVVGAGRSSNGFEAFLLEDGAMLGLGSLSSGPFYSVGFAVSGDGSLVVGWSASDNALFSEGFLWENGAMTGLGTLPGVPYFRTEPKGVSSTKTIVGLHECAGTDGQVAFIWRPGIGMQRLADVLAEECGLDLTGWGLREATGISDDGMTIIGWGEGPNGREGFIAVIPEPASLLIFAGSALVVRSRRRGGRL